MSYRQALPVVILVILVCLYVSVFGMLASRAYLAHETNALDLGNYDQALWNAARGQGLRLTLVPQLGTTRFAAHVEPILYLMVPIYRFISDDPRVLLWLQAIVIALGGLPLYGLACRRLGSHWAALMIVAAYFLWPALESVTLFEFHAVGLAPTLLLAGLYFLDRALVGEDDLRGLWVGAVNSQTSNRTSHVIDWLLSGFFFLLALATKEDISLHVLMLGLYLLALRRRWRPGLALAVLGMAWFYVAFYVVIPAGRPAAAESPYTGFFSALGDTPLQIALSPIRSPGRVAGLLATADNLRALRMLSLPLALMPFLGLPLFVLSAPTLAITMLSSNPLMQQLETYHYAAPAVAFVMLAAVDGIARLSNFGFSLARPTTGVDRRTPLYLKLATPFSLSLLVLITALIYHHYRGYSPLARSFYWPQVTAHERLGDELAASIPNDAPVIAQAELVPLLSHRSWIQIWQGPFDQQAEYFMLDVSHPAFVNRNGAQESLLSDMAQDPAVGPIATTDGYVLLQRGAPRRPTTPEFFTFVYADPPDSATPVMATFGDKLQLIAFETRRNYADREAEPLITLYWRALATLDQDYLISVFVLDQAGNPFGATWHQQPLTVWWPTSRWESGRSIRMLANTFPWWTGDRRHFGYGVAVVRADAEEGMGQSSETSPAQGTGDAIQDLNSTGRLDELEIQMQTLPWNVAARLRVVREDGGSAPLDEGTLLPLTEFQRVAGIPYEVRGKPEIEAEP
jgi:uncharacterized membrane protein